MGLGMEDGVDEDHGVGPVIHDESIPFHDFVVVDLVRRWAGSALTGIGI